MKQYQHLISRLGVAGYENVEPIILTCWGLGWPFRLAGRPGTAKTYLATLLSQAENGRDYARVFDCTKENVMTIAGLPDMEAMKKGYFQFVHKMEDGKPGPFIHSVRNIVLNELTRMSIEVQNLLLEPLQERTFFSRDLPIKRQKDPVLVNYSIIATENPEGIGVKRIDEAIFDRFYALVNVPDGQGVIGTEERRAIVGANIARTMAGENSDGKDMVLTAFAHDLRRAYRDVMNDMRLVEPMVQYSVALWETFLQDMKSAAGSSRPSVYVSNRRQAMFTEMALGLCAYRRATGDWEDASPPLAECARDALLYSVRLQLNVLEDAVNQSLTRAHNSAAVALGLTNKMTPRDVFEADLQRYAKVEDKIAFLAKDLGRFRELMNVAERDNLLGRLEKDASGRAVLALRQLILDLGGHEEKLRRAEIRIVDQVSAGLDALRVNVNNQVIRNYDDMVVRDHCQHMLKLVATKPLPRAVIPMFFEESGPVDIQIHRIIELFDADERKAPKARAKVKVAA